MDADRARIPVLDRLALPLLTLGLLLGAAGPGLAQQGGSITIVKQTVGGDGTFPFTTENLEPASFEITTVGGSESFTFDGLVAGQGLIYTVTEQVPGGWDFVGIECEALSDETVIVIDGASVDIDLGLFGKGNPDDVTCTFTNQLQTGSITIVKEALGGDGETFSFTGDLGAIELTVPAGGGSDSVTVDSLTPLQLYEVTEVVPAGWTLQGIECEGAGVAEFDIDPPSVIVNLLEPGEATCTFTNEADIQQTGSITIVKQASGGEGETFSFTGDLGDFQLTVPEGGGSDSVTFDGQTVPQLYEIAEVVPEGWTLTGIECAGTGAEFSVDPPSVTIDLAEPTAVTCTFANEPPEPVPALPGAAAVAMLLALMASAAWMLRRARARAVDLSTR